ncbi:MAG TPA: PhzF family phenazine biosynthesis protein [Pseudolabrys sp.]|nr:PhzF family phenazine biosynthesis protein [Pseudolabrys sp.]
MRRRFVTLDVFTEKRFSGNPLAVVLEADGLSGEAMQSIAREFNHPETVFVLPAEEKKHRARLRIFTPGAELPFAGHPTVGTAVLLNRIDGGRAADIVLEEKIGLVACRVGATGANSGQATFVIPQLPAETGTVASAAEIAAALSIDAADVGFDGYTPQRWSAGNAISFVPVRGLDAIGRAKPDTARFEPTFGREGRAIAYLYCAETAERGHDFHARMFAPKLGVAEDPATGSAAAAFPGVLVKRGRFGDGEHKVVIEQGYEMGRPSQMQLAFSIEKGALTRASVGGSAVVVTEGVIEA